MGHIERGDERQYFEKYTPSINTAGQIAELINQGAQSAVSITQKANASDIASKQMQLSAEWYTKNNEINLKYQADPADPQRNIELQEAFETLANKYKINPACQQQWSEAKQNVFDRFRQYNEQWAQNQQQTNAQINLKNGYESLVNQAYTLGQNGAGVDDIRLMFANGHDALQKGALPNLGPVITEEALKQLPHDCMAQYIDGITQNDPARALQYLNDESILNDLQDGSTIQKLKQTAQTRLLKKTELDAVDRVAGFINSNAELFNKVFDGTITAVEAQQLLQNKNIDKNMKHIISDMLGYALEDDEEETSAYSELTIGNKSWTFVNKKGQLRKPSEQEKNEITSELYLKGSRLLNGTFEGSPQEAVRQVAEFQSQVAQARYFGIDKGDYDKLMKDFVLPATQNIQTAAQGFSGQEHWFSTKYGYQQIENYFKKNFDDKDKQAKTEQALASTYYWSALNEECAQRGIPITELKNLPAADRTAIYNKCAQNAIRQAHSTSSNPQLWFRAANPKYVSAIRSMLPDKNADDVITNVAVSAMSNPAMSEKEFNAIIDKEVRNEYAKMRTSNKAAAFNGQTKYDDYINRYSMQYGVDPLLIKSIIKHESGFNPYARSGAGAGGLMQLMPATAKQMGCRNVLDPQQNVAAGVKYFSIMLDRYNGNIPLALAAYNAGPGNVDKAGGKIPNIKETQRYVKNIMATYNNVKG